ncbi:MAG TPA: TIM barrel protein [Sphingobium sp.]
MWHGTVRSLPFAQQLRATALAGCEAMSMTPYAYGQLRESGRAARDILRQAADEGVALFHLDPLIRWIEPWKPDLPPEAFPYELLSTTCDAFLEMARDLEAESITAWGAFPAGSLPRAAIIDAFGALCDRAAQNGLYCDMEFLPMYGVPTLEEAWAIIDAVGRPNARLVFDLWHYFRGKRDDALLATIPGEKIGSVQICDATAAPPPGVPLGLDGQTARRLPGEGEFAITEALDILAKTGGLRTVGYEIFSTAFDTMDAAMIAKAVKTSMDAILAPY